jgi:hypothetical protein
MSKFRKYLVPAAATGLLTLAAGPALAFDAEDHTAYIRTDLVSNLKDLVQPQDKNLQNAWGGANVPGAHSGFRTTMTAFLPSMTATG